MYDYVYPNNGDDSSLHLAYFDALGKGNSVGYGYLGRPIVGYPIVWLNKLLGVSIDTQFLWVNFIVLWLVGISVFALVAKMADWQAGLLSIPLVMFCTPSVLNLFDTGAIFDLMTVGVVFPLAMLCITYSITRRKLYWIIPTVVLLCLAVALHTMVIFRMHPIVKEEAASVSEFLSVFVGYPIVIMLLVVVFCIGLCKYFRLDEKETILLLLCGIVILAMIPLTFTGITAWATRFAIDLAIVVSIFTAFVLGIVVKRLGSRMVILALVFVLVSCVPILKTYFEYNSAVKPVDLAAISYMNSLGGEYFSCSPEVSPLIYNRFLNKAYKEGALPYIKRSKPMTSWTTPGTRDYWWGNSPVPDVPLDSAVRFGEGNLVIYVVR
jgi:hypothetical protein